MVPFLHRFYWERWYSISQFDKYHKMLGNKTLMWWGVRCLYKKFYILLFVCWKKTSFLIHFAIFFCLYNKVLSCQLTWTLWLFLLFIFPSFAMLLCWWFLNESLLSLFLWCDGVVSGGISFVWAIFCLPTREFV